MTKVELEIRNTALNFAAALAPADPSVLVADARIIEAYLKGEVA